MIERPYYRPSPTHNASAALGIFNASLMNEAILNFKRYEDASLSYAGIDRHANDQTLGAWDTTLTR